MDKKTNTDFNAAERHRLERIIRKLSRRVLRLKSRYNEHAPINRLPPELLTRIFFMLQSNFFSVTPNAYYEWTVVTHVSRSWRALALETKTLWTGITQDANIEQSPWIATSLERSRPCTLDVVMELNPRYHLYEMHKIDPRRMRNLCVNISQWTETNPKIRNFLSVLEGEMSALEDLSLSGDVPRRVVPRRDLIPIHLNFPAPHLKSIRINHFNSHVISIPFQGVTSLSICNGRGQCGTLTFGALLDFLRISRLETLKLEHALFEEDDADEDPTPIALPSLSSLVLELPAGQCVRLISHVVVLPSCQITLYGCSASTFTAGSAQLTTIESFLNLILPHLPYVLSDFIGVDIDPRQDSIAFALRSKQDWEQRGWLGEPLLGMIESQPSGHRKGDWLPFPSLSRFSAVWSVFVGSSGRPPGEVYLGGGPLFSEVADLPCLTELQVSVEVLSSFIEHLCENNQSFSKLTHLAVWYADCLPALIDELAKALASHTILGNKKIRVLLHGRPGWAEKESVLESIRFRSPETVAKFDMTGGMNDVLEPSGRRKDIVYWVDDKMT
ncbi:hypothetical protein BDN72DRAFT_865076 [Pluteus cervinus]|uniref:Uncharacterized protein n=1 Tax=Pluteus cervinus TaxID=181527 RepID=A0ACD3A1P4_9AGAR|nr:hypothetical protein BDN72DRAFT_865076 [Pluteus cervinus]